MIHDQGLEKLLFWKKNYETCHILYYTATILYVENNPDIIFKVKYNPGFLSRINYSVTFSEIFPTLSDYSCAIYFTPCKTLADGLTIDNGPITPCIGQI